MTIETLLDRDIRDETLKKRPLSALQHAYQRGKSADLSLDNLDRLLFKSLHGKEMVVATLLDVEGAFVEGFDSLGQQDDLAIVVKG